MKRLRVIFTILLFSLLLLVLGLLLITGFVFLEDGDLFGRVEITESYMYKHFEVDDRNRTFSGIVTLKKKLEEDQFVSYVDVSGTHHLISNFGTFEYYCTGSCYCDEYRRYSGVLRKGLSVLVAAATGLVAINIARETFQESCVKTMSEECEKDSVEAEVDSCKDVKSNEESSSGKEKEEEKKGEEEDKKEGVAEKEEKVEGKKEKKSTPEEDKKEIYECFGRCILKPDSWLEILKISLINWLEKRAMQKCLQLNIKAMMYYKQGESRLRYYGVETKFRDTILSDYCGKTSSKRCVAEFPRAIRCVKVSPDRVANIKVVLPKKPDESNLIVKN